MAASTGVDDIDANTETPTLGPSALSIILFVIHQIKQGVPNVK